MKNSRLFHEVSVPADRTSRGSSSAWQALLSDSWFHSGLQGMPCNIPAIAGLPGEIDFPFSGLLLEYRECLHFQSEKICWGNISV